MLRRGCAWRGPAFERGGYYDRRRQRAGQICPGHRDRAHAISASAMETAPVMEALWLSKTRTRSGLASARTEGGRDGRVRQTELSEFFIFKLFFNFSQICPCRLDFKI